MEPHEKLFSVRGKVIIITGGAGFLGRAYATFFARAGARVVLFDVLDRRILREKVEAIFQKAKRRPWGISVDITDSKAVAAAIRAVKRRYGRIDVLVNNAAMNPIAENQASSLQFSPYEKYSIELWQREFDIGLTGAFLVTQAVIPVMKAKRSGVIINVGSIYGSVAPDNRIYRKGKFKSIAYATVKGGLASFSRALASYLAPHGIRVNHLILGGAYDRQDRAFVKGYSSRTMLGRMASPDDFLGAMLYLASDASSYVTGADIAVDGGLTAW